MITLENAGKCFLPFLYYYFQLYILEINCRVKKQQLVTWKKTASASMKDGILVEMSAFSRSVEVVQVWAAKSHQHDRQRNRPDQRGPHTWQDQADLHAPIWPPGDRWWQKDRRHRASGSHHFLQKSLRKEDRRKSYMWCRVIKAVKNVLFSACIRTIMVILVFSNTQSRWSICIIVM